MMVRLSAVIPTYNCGRYLRQAIESALAQEHVDLEIVVVDDGSTDDTAAILASFGSRIRCLRQDNRGLPAARNAGIAASTGEAIAFLDADDTWEPCKSRKQLAYLDRNPRCALVFCDVYRIDESGERLGPVLGPRVHDVPEGRCLEKLFLGNFVLVPGVVVRSSALARVGGFDETLASVEDYDMWLRIAAVAELGIVPEPLASWRDRPGQMSRRRDRILQYEALVLERALERVPGLREALGAQARRRLARLYDEHGWWDLQEGRIAQALPKFLEAARRDLCWGKPYRHLLAVALAMLGLRKPGGVREKGAVSRGE